MSTDAWATIPRSEVTSSWGLATAAAPFLTRGADPYASKTESWPNEHMRLIALELVGPKTSTDAVRRALKRGDDLLLGGASTQNIPSHIPWAPGGIIEVVHRPPSGQIHLLLLHPQSMITRLDPEGRTFLVDSGEGPGHPLTQRRPRGP